LETPFVRIDNFSEGDFVGFADAIQS